MMNNLDFIDI